MTEEGATNTVTQVESRKAGSDGLEHGREMEGAEAWEWREKNEKVEEVAEKSARRNKPASKVVKTQSGRCRDQG